MERPVGVATQSLEHSANLQAVCAVQCIHPSVWPRPSSLDVLLPEMNQIVNPVDPSLFKANAGDHGDTSAGHSGPPGPWWS